MLVSTKQAAERLGVHPATIRRWAASGRVRFVRIGRERAIPAAEVQRLRRTATRGPRRRACRRALLASRHRALDSRTHGGKRGDRALAGADAIQRGHPM